jgi:hypothetical protein
MMLFRFIVRSVSAQSFGRNIPFSTCFVLGRHRATLIKIKLLMINEINVCELTVRHAGDKQQLTIALTIVFARYIVLARRNNHE